MKIRNRRGAPEVNLWRNMKPMRLSRSKVDLFIQCPKCFWLNVNKKISRPSGPPFMPVGLLPIIALVIHHSMKMMMTIALITRLTGLKMMTALLQPKFVQINFKKCLKESL
jgi:hypothetical protein